MSDDTKLAYSANHVFREGYDQAVQDLREEAVTLRAENEELKNRCFMHYKGLFCPYCNYECERRKFKFRGEQNE